MGNPSIRSGTLQDAGRISRLICASSEEFIVGEFTAEGRAGFLADHSATKVGERLAGDFRFYLAEDGDDLAAVAAIRANAHLYYLFVAKPYQGTGLARRLWSRVKEDSLALGNPGRFTVNASNHAVRAYEKLGFRRTEPTREKDGVLYNPMELTEIDGMETGNSVILRSELTCPHCGLAREEIMPTDACVFFYECTGCRTMLRPKPGDCCVFCSYGSVKCPPVQQSSQCCGPAA